MDQGKLKVELVTANNPRVVFDNYEETFNDGRWHVVVLSIKTNEVILSVDFRPMKTTRLLKIVTGRDYFFAGGVGFTLSYANTIFPGIHSAQWVVYGRNNVFTGFVGCMKTIRIDGNSKLPTDWKKDEEFFHGEQIIFDACRMTDR